MAGTPVVFVHGLWLHAESWGAWIARFNEAGYQATARGWPGDADTVAETRANPDSGADRRARLRPGGRRHLGVSEARGVRDVFIGSASASDPRVR